MRVYIWLIVLGILFGTSCEKTKTCKDDNLLVVRENYLSRKIKINGYYFGDLNASRNVKIYYLYSNGFFFDGGVEVLENAKDGNIFVDVPNVFPRTVKGAWGVFRVFDNFLEIERWQSSVNGCESTVYERGDILSDTLFIIRKREFRRNGKVVAIEEPNSLFYFRPLPQKPDSTNSFIQ